MAHNTLSRLNHIIFNQSFWNFDCAQHGHFKIQDKSFLYLLCTVLFFLVSYLWDRDVRRISPSNFSSSRTIRNLLSTSFKWALVLVIENVWDVLKMIWSQTAVGEIAFCFLQINPPCLPSYCNLFLSRLMMNCLHSLFSDRPCFTLITKHIPSSWLFKSWLLGLKEMVIPLVKERLTFTRC